MVNNAIVSIRIKNKIFAYIEQKVPNYISCLQFVNKIAFELETLVESKNT